MKNKGFITMMCWILLGFSLIGCSHQEEDKEIETLAQHFFAGSNYPGFSSKR